MPKTLKKVKFRDIKKSHIKTNNYLTINDLPLEKFKKELSITEI